ncbi:MAG: alpha/beta fold hydrolase [Gemmatimonadota bacterium]|nr:alpha/beta fold hydrolase [Gemmatimonadota bacterium]
MKYFIRYHLWCSLVWCFIFFIACAQASGQTPGTDVIETPADDAEFSRILEYYSYDPDLSLDPVVFGEWPWRSPHTLYKLSYRSVREQRVPSFLAIPKQKQDEPVPAVILMHGWNLFWGKNEDWVREWIPLLTASGRAVLAPDHFLYGERKVEGSGFDSGINRGPYYYRDWMCQSVVDLRRGIDYLASRPDIDPERIAIFGGSLGGWIGSILAGVDHRIKTAVLSVPATEFIREQTPAGRVVNSSNFFPRISPTPLLMVLAKQDSKLRNDRARALFELLKGKKKLIEYDEKHFLPPVLCKDDILQWLDENL